MKKSLHKFDQAIESIQKAKNKARQGEIREIKADIHEAIDRLEAAYWLSEAEEEESEEECLCFI